MVSRERVVLAAVLGLVILVTGFAFLVFAGDANDALHPGATEGPTSLVSEADFRRRRAAEGPAVKAVDEEPQDRKAPAWEVASLPEAQRRLHVFGSVFDPEGEVLAGAEVRLWEAAESTDEAGAERPLVGRTTTDRWGRFDLAVPAHDVYALVVDCRGFRPHADRRVPSGQALEIHLVPGAALRLRLVDARDSQGLPGVRARLADSRRGWSREEVSDADGRVRFDGIFDDGLSLELDSSEYRVEGPLAADPGEHENEEWVIAMDPAFSVTGRVLDPNGAPVAAALIRGSTRETRSAADGRYRLSGLPDGKSSIEVLAEGFATGRLDVQLSSGRPEAERDCVLELGATLAGQVVGLDGRGLPDVEVTLHESVSRGRGVRIAEGGRFQGRSDPEGRFRFDGIGRTSPALVVRAQTDDRGTSWSNVVQTASLTPSSPPLVIVLGAGLSLKGRVQGVDDTPIPGARLKLSLAERRDQRVTEVVSSRECRADDQGVFAFSGLGDGIWSIGAEAPGHIASAPLVFEIQGRRATSGLSLDDVVLTLETGFEIGGRVVDAEDHSVAAAQVRARGNGRSWNTISDAQGQFRFEAVDAGPLWVDARAEGFAPASQDGVAGGMTDLVLVLQPLPTVRFKVLDDRSGAAVAEFDAAVRRAGDRRARVLSRASVRDPDGTWSFAGAAGDYLLTVDSSRHLTQTTAFTLIEGTEPAEVLVRLTPAAVLEGRVIDRNGEAQSGVSVFLRRQDGVGPEEASTFDFATQTGADGWYGFDRLPEGTYELALHGPDRFPVSTSPWLRVSASAATRFDPPVPDPSLVDIRAVLDARGDPAPKVTIEIRSLEERPVSFVADRKGGRRPIPTRYVRTDASGGFQVRDLAPGRYRAAGRVGRRWVATEFQVSPSGRGEVTLSGSGDRAGKGSAP